jgi:hypothetical protein
MPYADPEKRRAYDRERRRRKRAEALQEAGTQKKVSTPTRAGSVADIQEILADEVARVREEDCDVVIRARTVGYLAGVLLRAFELGDLEKRLAALETELASKTENE